MGRQSRRIRRSVNGEIKQVSDRRVIRQLEREGPVCPCCGGPLAWSIESNEEHAARLLAEGAEVAR